MGYIFGQGTDIKTPEELARRRAVADALARSALSAPQNVGQGLSAIGQALAYRALEGRAAKAEQAGQASANAAFDPIVAALGGGGQFPAAPQASSVDMPTQRVAQAFGDAPGPANSYFDAIRSAESGGSDSAKNPLSSATGRYQFTKGTWDGLMTAHPELGLTPDGRTDPAQQERAIRVFTAQNAAQLQNAGIQPTGGNLYAAHFLGADGAKNVLTQPDNAPVSSFVGPEVVKANPFLAKMTVGDFKNWAASKGGGNAPAELDASSIPQRLPAGLGGQFPPEMSFSQNSPAQAALGTAQPASNQGVQVAQAAPAAQMSDADALKALGAEPVQNGATVGALLKAASNPWLNKNQSAIVQALLKTKLDPNASLDAEYKRAQIDHLRNPQANNRISYGQTPLMLTDPEGNMHMGQMSNGGGILIDGKTYNSLPEKWKVGTVSQSGSGGLSPEALDIISTQYLAGDKTAIQGFSRNAAMRAQLANAIAEKANAMGMDGKAIAAEVSAYGGNVAAQRAAGTRAAQVGMAASEASQMADIAVEASQSVPRGSFMPWNAIQNAVRTGTSSPEMAAFVTATTSLVNAYARAVSPLGAPTDAMRQHAEQMLNTAQSPQAYAAVINQMKKEMEAALNAPAEISEGLKKQVTGAHGQSSEESSANQKIRRYNPQTGELE